MPLIKVSASAALPAPAADVFALIADYRNGHPRILPREYFPTLEVEKGGVGAGTVIRFQVVLFGATRDVRAEITEPVPGQVLLETDLATGARTTFTVTPWAEGAGSDVRIETEWEAKGLRGWIEGRMAPPMLRRIYVKELANLVEVMRSEAAKEV